MMKKSILLTSSLCLLLFNFSAFCQSPISKEDRKKALTSMNESKDALLKTINGLSVDQLNFKSTAESWSIAECVEHIAISEGNLFGIIEMTLQSDPDPSLRDSVKLSDEMIVSIVKSRDQKVKTRKEFEPTGSFGDYDSALKAFKDKRTSNMDFIKSTEEDLRNRYFDFPFGKTDSYQVLLFISAHTLRHLDQIKEVMAHEDFPAKS